MKHAYLIMCHQDNIQLRILLSLLDYSDNDIYIHMDKKCRVSEKQKKEITEHIKKSNIYFIKSKKVTWAADSMMKVEMRLLQASTKNDYSYYHLISGSDLPIKSQNFIHDFFDNSCKDYVRLELNKTANINKTFLDRFRYYYPLQNLIGKEHRYISVLQSYFIKIQKIFDVDRTKKASFQYLKGSQWFSITHETALTLIHEFKRYKRFFIMSHCPDESFVQTILYNSDQLENVIDDNLRFIVWDGGASPITLKRTDFESIMNSGKLFARKFDMNVDSEIIKRIKKCVESD